MKSSNVVARFLLTLQVAVFLAGPVFAATGEAVQKRISAQLLAGRPLVVHATVVLSDGSTKPDGNPWWGGPNGLLTVFVKKSGWKLLARPKPSQPGQLERVVLAKTITREGRDAEVYLVADAWEEGRIQEALVTFYAHARGASPEKVVAEAGSQSLDLQAGGDSVITAYLGRNGMEDVEPTETDTYNISPEEEWLRRAAARPDAAFGVVPKEGGDRPISAVVLCSYSKAYFLDKLRKEGAHPLLLTLAALTPEAYALEASITAWVGNKPVAEVRNAGAAVIAKAMGLSRDVAREVLWSGQ